MIEKKDWEDLKKDAEKRVKACEIDLIQFNTLIKMCDEKLKEFPVEKKEDDPMPEEVKGIIDEVKK